MQDTLAQWCVLKDKVDYMHTVLKFFHTVSEIWKLPIYAFGVYALSQGGVTARLSLIISDTQPYQSKNDNAICVTAN